MADYDDLAAEFANGDVLYGLDGPRAAGRAAILRAGMSSTTPVTRMIFCCIPRTVGTTKNVLIQNDLTNEVWDPSSPTTYASDTQLNRTLTDGARGRNFRNFLSQHDRYNVAEQFSDHTLDASQTDDVRTAWTRTSKGGLEFQARRGRTVHFIIEDLKFNDIATKSGYGEKGNITSAEIRWLYRHRNTPEVQDHVRFWLPDGEVSHGTMWADTCWASYKPSREVSDFGAENTIRSVLNSSSN